VLVDSHCHLADEAFAQDLTEVARRAEQAGVGAALCILAADDEAELARVQAVRDAWPAARFAGAIHPHAAGRFSGRAAEAAGATRAAVKGSSAIAVGEIGLDYHYDFAPKDVQREVFAAQIALALELDVPVIIHTREAAEDTYAILREAGEGRVRGVMHCFSGTAAEARAGLDLGFYISLSGILTFPKAGELRETARMVPPDRVLVETDAPFLAPVPHRGKRNEPAWVTHTVGVLATVHDQSAAAMAEVTTENFERLFRAGLV
jgi:TatD DNase family protein